MRCVTLACSFVLVWALPGAAQDIRTVARAPQSAAASAATGSLPEVPELPARAVPAGIAVDARGNLYVGVDVLGPEPGAGRILVLATGGTLKSIADGADHSGMGHTGLVTDADGNVLIADAGRSAIQHIDTRTGVTTTLFSGEPLSHPIGLALDRAGNLYVADSAANAVFVLRAKTGKIDLFAHVAAPGALAVGPSGASVYVAALATGQVFRIDAKTRAISLTAGTGRCGSSRDLPGGDISAASVPLASPCGIAVDAGGNLFIADAARNIIRRVDAKSGIISAIAGTGHAGYAGDGGPATEAELNAPGSLALDREGNLYFADQGNGAVRVVQHAGVADQASSANVTLTCSGGGTACFTFAPEPSGGSEGPQTILLSNNSGATLVINSISFVGADTLDFVQANSCGTTLATGLTCNINVTFTPKATGPRFTTLTVVDSDGSSPQTAQVTGTGDDYELGAPMGGSLTTTIMSGATANYSLVVTSVMTSGAEFAGTVTLVCPFPSTLPPQTTCSISPSSVTVAAGMSAPFTVSLATVKHTSAPGPVRQFPALPWPRGLGIAAAIALLFLCSAVLAKRFSRQRSALGSQQSGASAATPSPATAKRRLVPVFALLAVFVFLSGCYHHGSHVATGTFAGTYNITITGNAQNASRAVTLTLVVQ
jgi:sugar lactone lactonase YvrE